MHSRYVSSLIENVLPKEVIKKHSKDFGGSLNDTECMSLTGLARNTFYKYKKELRDENLRQYRTEKSAKYRRV